MTSCEFVQVNPHEWRCETHGVTKIAGTQEPNSCGGELLPRPGHVVALSELPPCDLCSDKPAVWDGPTTMGPWAYMCQSCAEAYHVYGGRETGVGIGQRLIVRKEEP